MSPAPPPVVADRYRLIAPLGQGGMGRVWRATDVVLHREVAIKELVPPPGLTIEERQEMRERSLREARAIARLNNINVVRVFDVLRTDADPWIVMEYVPSRSLHDVLASDGPVTPERAAEIGLGVLNALRAAHRAGVVHRDVKPANVLLGDDGRVVLTDFGLATVPGDPNVTRTGLVLGSPAYIAPERAKDGTAGPGADLWSLGATLYAAVEGASPYARPSAIATLAALATENPPPARNAGGLKPVLNGLLRKDPNQRISADEAERLLNRVTGRRSRLGFTMNPTMRRPGAGRDRESGSPPPAGTVHGGIPVVPGPRPPASSVSGNRPTVFRPGKATVGRPAALGTPARPTPAETRVEIPASTPPPAKSPQAKPSRPEAPTRVDEPVSKPDSASVADAPTTVVPVSPAAGTTPAASAPVASAPVAPAPVASAPAAAVPALEGNAALIVPPADVDIVDPPKSDGPPVRETERRAAAASIAVPIPKPATTGSDADAETARGTDAQTRSEQPTDAVEDTKTGRGRTIPGRADGSSTAASGRDASGRAGADTTDAAASSADLSFDATASSADLSFDATASSVDLSFDAADESSDSATKRGAGAAVPDGGSEPGSQKPGSADVTATPTSPASTASSNAAPGRNETGTPPSAGTAAAASIASDVAVSEGGTAATTEEGGPADAGSVDDATPSEAASAKGMVGAANRPRQGGPKSRKHKSKAARAAAARRDESRAESAAAVVGAPSGATIDPVVTTPAASKPESIGPAAIKPAATAPKPGARPVPSAGKAASTKQSAAKLTTTSTKGRPVAGRAASRGTAAAGVKPTSGRRAVGVPVPSRSVPGKEPSLLALAGRELVKSRRRIAILVAVVAALVLVIVLVATVGGDKPAGRGASPVASVQPSAAVSVAAPPVSAAASAQPSSPAPSSPAPSTEPPTANPQQQLPAGWHLHQDPAGWSVPVPGDWAIERKGTETYFREPSSQGGRLLLIQTSDHPKPDPVADWTQQESERRYADYRRIRIDAVNYFRAAADWEFTYSSNSGNPLHVVKRGLVVADDLAYGIHWSTSQDDWAGNLGTLDIIYKGFIPAKGG